MSDQYEQVRSLPFPTLAAALGLDLQRFKRRKEDWQGYCPIHQSQTNNNCFAYNDDGRFHCFSCEAKGRGAIDLTKLVKNLGFKEAVEFLGSVPPAATKQEPVEAPVNAGGVLQPLAKDSWRKFAVPCPWLEARIPDAAVRERYGVFCYNNPARRSAYSGRVMLPVKSLDGGLYGYLGRDISSSSGQADHPKYLFPKNLPKSHFLFGAHELLAGSFGPAPLRVVYLVESPFCVMKFAMFGLPALSPFGWHPSDEQIHLLQGLAKGLVYLPDRNKTAETASIAGMLASKVWLRFPPLPDQVDDPEHLSLQSVVLVRSRLREVLHTNQGNLMSEPSCAVSFQLARPAPAGFNYNSCRNFCHKVVGSLGRVMGVQVREGFPASGIALSLGGGASRTKDLRSYFASYPILFIIGNNCLLKNTLRPCPAYRHNCYLKAPLLLSLLRIYRWP